MSLVLPRRVLAIALTLALAGTAAAQTPPATTAPAPADRAAAIEAEQNAAFEAANKVAKFGPAEIPLIDQGTLTLPAGYAFVPQPEAGRIERANGNSTGDTLVGLVFPDGDANWYASLDHIKEGYIREDDAKDWNADELLTNLKDGTEANNEDRAARGFPPLAVTGWIESPQYDAATHRLVWSARVVRKNDTQDEGSANYNTYALGREGYFSLDLVTSTRSIDGFKTNARELLNAISYSPGKRYEDFTEGTDRVAEYGLAALVAGVAAKKLGLIAIIGAFVLKFAKVIVIAVGAFGVTLAKLFRRKPRDGGVA
ncbi:DUF2167 domain-containing protein [Inquilinus limosus]|uniref:Membrane protein n=1 Tax=Inquilinus limosus MP06 TaxID=1398085 RepID=A0A0A0DDI2_9PROT|nr:DUF2167 domain-containing protein [Inquilinus limosus]KGM35928.1 membrane protein [Inquilinus limosus MP06]